MSDVKVFGNNLKWQFVISRSLTDNRLIALGETKKQVLTSARATIRDWKANGWKVEGNIERDGSCRMWDGDKWRTFHVRLIEREVEVLT